MAPPERDVITIGNLSLPHPIAVPDAWSFTPSAIQSNASPTDKLQPVTVSMRLLLKSESFLHAARDDTVNPDHTVHYGELSKAVRAKIIEGQNLHDLMGMVASIVADWPAVEGATTLFHLPKGSMFGSKAQIGQSLQRLDHGPMEGTMIVTHGRLVVEGLPMTCLIGVNANERTGKQPLVVGFDIDFEQESLIRGPNTAIGEARLSGDRKARMLAAFAIESHLFEIIEKTSFETLESLIEFTYGELRRQHLDEKLPGARFRLQIAKPRAIIFADAPTVEIHRTVPVGALQR